MNGHNRGDLEGVLRSGVAVWRKIGGEDTAVERVLKRQYKAIRSRIEKRYNGRSFVLFWSGAGERNRIGIYLKGSCDLLSIIYSHPTIDQIGGGKPGGDYRICIAREGLVSDARSDVILQTLQTLPQEWVDPVIEKFKLPADYFQPKLFEKSFSVTGIHGPEQFPKKVVVLSIAADTTRVLYRHKEHGFIVDPGGWWFNRSMDTVLIDISVATWFKENFASIGRISVDSFIENFTKIIKLIKENTGAHVLVFNTFTVDPGNLTHNYQFVKNSPSMRRREFNLALVELSRKIDFSIVDVDRVLKKAGFGPQQDFAHFPTDRYEAIAQETFRIMRDLGVF